MARIPDDELERVKRETNLAELVRESGVELKAQGRDLVGLCPFHEDHQPSLFVSTQKNLWHCMGCGAGGSVLDWLMRSRQMPFREAAELLLGRLGGAPVNGSSAGPQVTPLIFDATDRDLMRQLVEYYKAAYLYSTIAQGYARSRGIHSLEAVEHFTIGFCDRTRSLPMPSKEAKAGRVLRKRLHELGVTRDSGYEFFNNCLVFPVFDADGTVTEIYGRKTSPKSLRNDYALHRYLPGPRRRGVWNLPALRDSRELILTESVIDGVTLWVNGFTNVTCSYGVNGFTQDHLEAMKAYGTNRVLIAYDRDEAGDAAARKLADKLGAEGITCLRVLLPRGMDVNEYALKVSPAHLSLAVPLRSAEYMAGPLTTFVPLGAAAAAEPSGSPPDDAQPPPPSSSAAPAAGGQPRPTSAPAPALVLPAEVSEHEVVVSLGERRWRVRGLAKNLSYEQLRVNLMVSTGGDEPRFHVDTLDLHSARQRGAFLKQAALELDLKPDLVKRDLGLVFLKLEQLQHEAIVAALEPEEKVPQMSEEERQEATALLADPALLDRVVADLSRCGLVGEETNKAVAYLAAVSRKLDKPLAVMVQSSSAAGKSALMNAVLSFMPAEDKVSYSAMTGQSLFYMDAKSLKSKVLAIAEEEGAQRASYALKLLQSEGELSIASTGKNPSTGRLVTHEYHVEGPVALITTSTAIDLDEELMNRCLVLSVDESREQTRAIHQAQRRARTAEGIVARQRRGRVTTLHQNAQRLLKAHLVENHYAERLTFGDDTTRSRRDNEKYLSLIEAVTLLYQHQRPLVTKKVDGDSVECLLVTLDDVALANRLADEVLGRTLDELPPQTRRFLELLHSWVKGQCEERAVVQRDLRFSRRQARLATGWSYAQVRKHLDRLVELEYLLVHRGGRGQSFVYELLWDGRGADGERFFTGLLDVEALTRAAADETLTPQTATLTPQTLEIDPPLTPVSPPFDPTLTSRQNETNSNNVSTCERSEASGAENAHPPSVTSAAAPPVSPPPPAVACQRRKREQPERGTSGLPAEA